MIGGQPMVEHIFVVLYSLADRNVNDLLQKEHHNQIMVNPYLFSLPIVLTSMIAASLRSCIFSGVFMSSCQKWSRNGQDMLDSVQEYQQ